MNLHEPGYCELLQAGADATMSSDTEGLVAAVNEIPAKDELADEDPFAKWTRKIDSILERRIGMESVDLPDQYYMDWFEDGMAPVEAAEEVIENVRGEFEL